MATIGEIRKITIGGNTYTIPVYDLPIASSSTLGGVKVGTGLSIDATTGILSTSITESDPVFSASVAAGITATDISNWNSKSDTDEKVKQNSINSSFNAEKNILLGRTLDSSLSDNSDINTTYKATWLTYRSGGGYGPYLYIKNPSNASNNFIRLGYNGIAWGRDGYTNFLESNTLTSHRILSLPDKSGTIALISDIPDTSSFLTSETDPVFSASAAAGITSTDISNWNNKVSDDKTWNGVALEKSSAYNATIYIPFVSETSDATAYYIMASSTPLTHRVPLYDGSSYLKSTTPSANDNSTKVATTAYVDSAITALPEPMIFKGSLGTEGTITSLPAASSSNEGFTYKVITAGTYASQSAKVGDTFISDGSTWVLIPSGDEPSGTVTSVGISSGGGLSVSGSPITSSGTITISHADTSSQASSSNSGRTYIQSLTLDGYGHVTGISTATETVVNTDEKVKTTKASYNSNEYGIVLGSIIATTETKKVASGFSVTLSSSDEIYLWLGTDNIKGNLCLANNNYYTYLKPSATVQRTITLPDKDGTVALTSDIPTVPTNVSAFTNDAGYLTSYTETDPTVPSWAKASSKPTYTASEVGALSSSTTYVSKITTTAGAHSAISNQSGAVSFNVPTNTSHLTNDSGFVTTDTNTTYSLSNALSSHKFTETLTAGGSGSGTSTATIELAAGTGISLTDDTSNKKITINCTVTNSDEKVKSAAVTAATTYYLIGSTNSATETATTSKHGSVSIAVGADSNTAGGSRLTLGNSTAEGTAGAKYGYLRLYGNTTHYVDLRTEASYPTANRTIYLPSYGGTMYLTCTSTTDAVGNAAVPVYVDNTGRIQPVDTITIGLIDKPFMRATGSGTRVNVSADTITQVPLTTIEFQSEYSGISLDTTKHTILLEPGYYRISGSIYFATGYSASSMQGVYIRMGSTNVAFANATEVAASWIFGCVSINTSTIVKAIDNCYLWLGARSSVAAAVDSNNTATYLTAEKIGSIY